MNELKEVIHYYLPYKVMFKYQGQENEDDQFEMIGIDDGWVSGRFTDSNLRCDIMPILIPLKSITKDIIIEWELSEGHVLELCQLILGHRTVERLHFSVLQVCLKNHVDIFGLIESGQAIEK